MKTLELRIALLFSALLSAGAAIAADEPAKSGDGVVAKVEKAVAKGAHAAASGVERGVKAAGRGVKRGADATERGVKRAAKATAGAASKAGSKISGSPSSPASSGSKGSTQ